MPKSRISRLPAAAIIAVAVAFLSQTSVHGARFLPLRPSQNTAASPAISLEALLAKAAEYCRKLESAAFDFVCREEISEKFDPTLDADRKSPPLDPGKTKYSGPTVVISWARKAKRSFVYDYRCVRAGRTIRETRTLLKENGKKKVGPNAALQTSVVDFGAALLAPVGLFGERFQPDYDFAIAGEEKIGKIRVLVVDAKPKPGAPPAGNLYGKAWIDPDTGDILEIEWSESRVGRFDVFEKRGRLYDRKPRLVIRSEFNAEKNGIRFPSRLSVEEAYLGESGKAFIRSKTDVIYKDFKFFTVEFEVHD